MYTVIMAPTDLSDVDSAAISVAAKLAQRFDADLHLVSVLVPPIVAETLPQIPALEITERALADERHARLHKLEALGAEVGAKDRIRVVIALKDGNAEQTLRDYAAELKADLIVMSSHSRGGLKRITLGSVTDFLIRNTHVPVLIVKPEVSLSDEAAENSAHGIVVPLDGSSVAEQILPEVVALASALHVTVTVLHVLTPQTYSQKRIIQPGLPWWQADIEAANSYLSGPAHYLAERGIAATTEVILDDNVATAILDYATRFRADLIAIATNGIGGIRRFVFGTVADEVSRRSQISLLVLHPNVETTTGKERPASEAGTLTQA